MASHGLLSRWKSSGGSRGAPPSPTLFFDQNFFPNFLETAPLHLSQGLDNRPPPPSPVSEGLDPH